MVAVSAQPPTFDLRYFPGNAVTLTATFPVDYLDTREIKSFLGGRATPGVELTCVEDGDELTITLSAAQSIVFDGPAAWELDVYTAPSTYATFLTGTWIPGTEGEDAPLNIDLSFDLPGSTTFSIDGNVGLPGPAGAAGANGTNGTNGAPGADGVVQSIVAGTNVTVDDTDPANPVVSASGGGGSGTVEAVVAGNGMDVDDTDPANPIVAIESALTTKLAGIETGADVTDATNVAAAGAVMESDYDANTILAATADNTPVALTVAASRVVGRKASGDIAAMSTAELAALFGTPDGAKFLADDGTLKTPTGGAIGPSQVTTKTTTYTAAAGDLVLASASGGAWVLTLPAVSAGRWVTVKKTDSSANAITVTPASGTIDGASTYPISTQYTSRDFISDGTNWFVV